MHGSRELLCAAAICGLAVDFGAVSLAEVSAMVDRCRDYDELSARLATLADDARAIVDGELPMVCYPPAPAGRFCVVGEVE